MIVLKLLLQALAMNWKPDTDAMTTEISQDSVDSGSTLPSVCDNNGRLYDLFNMITNTNFFR